MSLGLTFEDVLSQYEILRLVFHTGKKDPFDSLCIRRAYKDGDTFPSKLPFTQQFRLIQSGRSNLITREPCPNEGEYIAVITLLNGYKKNIKPYVFKIKADGSFLCSIPFEYNKQPIKKWIKYIHRWIADFECMSGIRAQLRCHAIKQELIEKTWINQLEWD
jgi:hypothetical protein